MNLTIKKLLSGLAVTSMIFLSACGENGTEVEQSQNIIPQADQILFELPSSVQAQTSGALAKDDADDSGVLDSVYNMYRPIPMMIGLANETKNNIADLITELRSYEIEGDLTFEENGQLFEIMARDTSILGYEQELFDIRVSKEDTTLLRLYYWKNARDQFRGSCYFRSTEGEEAGNEGIIHFNNHNKEAFGSRLEIAFRVPEEKITGDKINDPSVIRMAAVKKGSKVFITGLSYHPNFSAPDGFWEAEPKIYSYVAVADAEDDVAVMKVGFAPATASRSELMTTYALDKQILLRATETFKTFLQSEEMGTRAALWSIENEKSFVEYYAMSAEDTAAYTPEISVEELTPEDLQTFIRANWLVIMAGDDQGAKEFAILVTMKQPIYFSAGNVLSGTGWVMPENWSDAVSEDDFSAPEAEIMDPGLVDDFEPESDTSSLESGEENSESDL